MCAMNVCVKAGPGTVRINDVLRNVALLYFDCCIIFIRAAYLALVDVIPSTLAIAENQRWDFFLLGFRVDATYVYPQFVFYRVCVLSYFPFLLVLPSL